MMSTIQNNDGSVEQSAPTNAPTMQQRRSVDRSSQQSASLLKENFQFYQPWSPNSLEEIDCEYGSVDNGSSPIVVAPPNYGPLQQPPPLSPRQKRYNKQSAEQSKKDDVADTATTDFETAWDNNTDQRDGMTVSAPPVLNTPQRLKQSLNSLLTTPTLDPLFDDDEEGHKLLLLNEDSSNNDNLQPREFYHSDDAITSWIWKPEQLDYSKRTECSLSCALERGRAVHATEPLLGVVSSRATDGDSISGPPWSMNTNLNLLHKAIDITVKCNNVKPVSDGSASDESSPTDSYELYQARHPSLAPLIYVENLANDADDDTQSILSIFDITPTHHQSLRELLRTDEFFSKPLFPGVEGHELECIDDNNNIHHQLKRRKPLAWLKPGDNASDQSLCRCHKIFDTDDDWGVQENMQTITQQTPSPSKKGTEESEQVSSPARTQQFNFGDLRKWPLRERRLKRHQVGTAYRADVADLRIRFLALQLFHAVDFCHSKGVTLGDQLSPDRIFVQDDGWIRIVPPVTWKEMNKSQTNEADTASFQQSPLMSKNGSPRKDWRTIFHRQHGRPPDATSAVSEGYKIIPYIGYGDTHTMQWQKGLLTNLAYLMMLNAAAGRTVGSQHNPPMLPWVTNFAGEIDLRSDMGNLLLEKSPYWRDLSKSKFRLTKGDDQLDHTYQNLRHHVPETLSEITYTVYKARVLPIHQLRSTIRDEFIAEHYPDSLRKMYEWSPDEATIEFFVPTEPCPFKSLHNEMSDLSLPKWCESAAHFINYHRNLLESEHVSKHLHLWIDLTFGEALTGDRAVTEKNVPLHCSRKLDDHHLCQGDCHSVLSGVYEEKELRLEPSCLKSLFVQLFSHRHPKKHSMLRNAITTKIRTAVNRERELEDEREDGKRSGYDLAARRKRDISMIGVLLNDCYNAVRVIPSPDVQSAIANLLCGSLDLHHSLNEDKRRHGSSPTPFPFPKHLKAVYNILSRAQNLTFQRLPSEVVSDDNVLTIRSTDLEQVWTLLRNADTECIDKLPASGVGLILPTLLHPLSGKHMEENYMSSRPFSSFAENLCNYLIALSNKVPGEVLLPRLLRLLQTSSDRVDITEQLSKVFLSRPLIGNMYSSSGGEYFVSKICRFLLKQLCCVDEPSATMLDRSTVGVFFTSLLAQDDVVGTSICCHYVIPLLMDNLELCSHRSCGNMIVKSIKSLLPFLPEDAIGVLICKKILRKVIPKVLSRGPSSVDNIQDVILLTELVVLLQQCLRHLDSENIVKNFFRTNSGSISNVLSSSMAWALSGGPIDDRKYYEVLLKEASVLVCNMFQRIESYQLHDTLLPLLESFCSLVNDSHLTDVLNESVLPRDGEERNEVLSRPGVKETNSILHEALEVCEEEMLKTSCPSVAEFLAFLNPPEKEASKIDEITAKDCQKQGLHDEKESKSRDEKESKTKSDGMVSLYKSISLSNNNKLRGVSDGSSIEMLSPKDLNMPNESVVKDSVTSKKKSRLVRNNSSFSQKSTDGQMNRKVKDKLDLVWLLGLHKQDKEERIKYSWRPRMMLSTRLDIEKSSESEKAAHVNCMATNQSESLLASGTSDGELLLFDLRRHPPALCARHRFHCFEQDNETARPIEQVDFFDAGGRLLVCDGGLHLFDAETQSVVTSLSSKNAYSSDQGGKPWKYEDIVAFSTCPPGTGSAEILDGSMGDISAISSAYLYGIDMRCSESITSRNCVAPYKPSQPDALFKSLTWHTGIATKEYPQSEETISPQEQDSSFNFTCLTSHCGGGDWVCVGSSSGHIHIFDRRRGKLLACWRAHQKAVVCIKSISRYKIISASADKTAVLWNIMSSPPQKLSSIYNIPGKEHSMNIACHYFREDGLVSVPDGDLILCAVTGRKTVFMPMTQSQSNGSPLEVKADRTVMSDCESNPIPSSEKLKVSSVALLPCRQLVLLGCEGEIHVCL
mmetsp:Transcript_12917/g.26030  ORF Transcript_12917/g.26030 Transcript_12917/m.26030 type:complete len:1928 (+) Transcript_12917:157-5940(+)